MLKHVIIELEHSPIFEDTRHHLIWQQDGPALHFGLIIPEFLSKHFNDWVGRCGITIEWPTQTPDLTP